MVFPVRFFPGFFFLLFGCRSWRRPRRTRFRFFFLPVETGREPWSCQHHPVRVLFWGFLMVLLLHETNKTRPELGGPNGSA